MVDRRGKTSYELHSSKVQTFCDHEKEVHSTDLWPSIYIFMPYFAVFYYHYIIALNIVKKKKKKLSYSQQKQSKGNFT